MKDIKIVEEAKQPMAMHPGKFALWLFIVSVIMIFGALTSAYIVNRGDGSWLYFELPSMFWVSTGIIVLSSGTMHWAYRAVKRDEFESAKVSIVLTLVLGIAFLAAQWLAFLQLIEERIHFVPATSDGNSGSFVYVLSGLHGAHVISAIIVLAVALAAVFKQKVHSKNMTRMELCTTYWHFLGGLWLYLFVFLLLNR